LVQRPNSLAANSCKGCLVFALTGTIATMYHRNII